MRIGIDARSLQGTELGIGRYLANLIKYYPQLDKANEYVLYFDREVRSRIPAGMAAKVLRFPGIKHSAAWVNIRLPIELSINKIDLFHSPFYGLPFIKICPMIFTVHDIIFEVHPEWYPPAKRMFLQLFSRWASRSARKIIAVSEHSKRDFIERYSVDEGRIEVIYEAADGIFRQVSDNDKMSVVKQRYNIKKEFVLCVGAINRRKNVTRLLEAFRKLKKSNLDMQLVLVGRIFWPFADLKRMIDELDLMHDVIHLENIPDEDLLYLYNAAEAMVYPSLYEGFGLPLVEAMACGTPIIASNATSIPEVVGDAGVLFDPNSVDDIAEKMAIVLKDPRARSEMSGKSLERSKRFSWQEAAQRTISLYNSV